MSLKLDLLLYVVNKSEVDIKDIILTEITRQYLDYIELMEELNINVASEYLSMAATLIRLKAREILPPDDNEELDSDEEMIINREQLIEKLLEYKKYKEAAEELKSYEEENIGTFTRGKNEELGPVRIDDENEEVASVNMFDLMTAFKRVMERLSESDDVLKRHVITMENVRLDDRIERVLTLVEDGKEILFDKIFEDDARRITLVVTFMAILELIKMKQIIFRQEELLGSIFVRKRTDFSDLDVNDISTLNEESKGEENGQ